MTYFRRHIKEDGVRKIFEVSAALHGDKAKETEVVADTTVQEKNVTFPTDTKLLTKVITQCPTMARLKLGIYLGLQSNLLKIVPEKAF